MNRHLPFSLNVPLLPFLFLSIPLLPSLSFLPSSLLPSIILTLYLTNTHELSVLTGRLHLSDRAHIVFDFHQAIDGLNEAKLGDKKLGEK